MEKNEILNTDILRARIAELEYGKTEMISADLIRRIYIEETGKDIPAEITVYYSKDLSKTNDLGKDSGFDGAIIHFYNAEQGLNQSYTITRGSENREDGGKGLPHDWIYNSFGIFAGKVQDQYLDARYFDEAISKKINEKVDADINKRKMKGEVVNKVELEKFGIGHSLGGNLIQMLQLMTGSYKNVYAINDAPPSAYQLAFTDREFRRSISRQFNIDPDTDKELYSIPPSQLKAFAEEYYKEKGKNIYHLTAEEDMLYAVSGFRGFLDLGDRKIIDTDPGFEGIRPALGNISDKDLHKLQIYLAYLAPYYSENGMDGLLRGATGIDKGLFTLIDTVEQEWKVFMQGPDWRFPSINIKFGGFPFPQTSMDIPVPFPIPHMPKGLFIALGELNLRVLEIKTKLSNLTKNLPALFSILADTAIVMKDEIMSYLKEIKGHLKNILKSIGSLGGVILKDVITPMDSRYGEYYAGLMNIAATLRFEIANIKGKIRKIFEVPNGFAEDFSKAVEAHGVGHVASALAMKDGVRYEGNDMIRFKTESNGQKIEVNLSSAVRIYQLGMDKYSDKENVLTRMRDMYHREYVEDYQNRKNELLSSINHMESNPNAYQHLLPAGDVEMRGITVHELIRPLDTALTETFEDAFHYFDEEKKRGIAMLKKIRSSIVKLFHEDKRISAIFDLR
ncbi:flagellar protein FlgN [Neobacillus sp. WH10]|uniref:DUF6792 domain-containing protein n=1 Tax=Neobacillus sp. WH10 TaxID=3047873 RepID=UPI0024C1CA7D|nr:DUF6792 domain-containing protein [Neobacillus sp. WH10]WHY78026.1 flagellar protein FlgN [Neobacillus sp. WH10]